MTKHRLMPLIFLLLTLGCSQPTLDTTSGEVFEQSWEVMLAALSEEEAKDLEHSLGIIITDGVDLSGHNLFFADDEEEAELDENILEHMKQFQGRTAHELISHARTLPGWSSRLDSENQ